jgi:hypothetical protein
MRKPIFKCPCCCLSGNSDLFEPDWPIEFSNTLHKTHGTCAEKDVHEMTWQEKRYLLNTLRRFKEEHGT